MSRNENVKEFKFESPEKVDDEYDESNPELHKHVSVPVQRDEDTSDSVFDRVYNLIGFGKTKSEDHKVKTYDDESPSHSQVENKPHNNDILDLFGESHPQPQQHNEVRRSTVAEINLDDLFGIDFSKTEIPKPAEAPKQQPPQPIQPSRLPLPKANKPNSEVFDFDTQSNTKKLQAPNSRIGALSQNKISDFEENFGDK